MSRRTKTVFPRLPHRVARAAIVSVLLVIAPRPNLAQAEPAAKIDAYVREEMARRHIPGLRDDWDEDDTFFSSKTAPAEFFEALKAAPLKFAPGTGWSYGCGPFLLGLVIERVTGEPYAQFMRESFFQPLGMSSTDIN